MPARFRAHQEGQRAVVRCCNKQIFKSRAGQRGLRAAQRWRGPDQGPTCTSTRLHRHSSRAFSDSRSRTPAAESVPEPVFASHAGGRSQPADRKACARAAGFGRASGHLRAFSGSGGGRFGHCSAANLSLGFAQQRIEIVSAAGSRLPCWAAGSLLGGAVDLFSLARSRPGAPIEQEV